MGRGGHVELQASVHGKEMCVIMIVGISRLANSEVLLGYKALSFP